MPIAGTAFTITEVTIRGGPHIQAVVLVLLAILIAWLLSILVRASRERAGRRKASTRFAKPQYGKPCPLCKTPLRLGERVHSVVYSGPGESFVEIYGCPHCRPPRAGETASATARTSPRRPPRSCPVCKQELTADGYVVGRMQEKNGTTYLRILGCTRCRTVR